MHGMFLHILADTLGSLGVIVSSILIELYGWTWADPICSLFIAVMIVMSVWPLVKSSALILLQSIPYGYDTKIPDAQNKIMSIFGVVGIEAIHVWELSTGSYVATVIVRIASDADDQKVKFLVQDILASSLKCRFTVVQVDREGYFLADSKNNGLPDYSGHDHHAGCNHDHHSGHDHSSHAGHNHDHHSGHDHSSHAGHNHDHHSGHDHSSHAAHNNDHSSHPPALNRHYGHDHSGQNLQSSFVNLNNGGLPGQPQFIIPRRGSIDRKKD